MISVVMENEQTLYHCEKVINAWIKTLLYGFKDLYIYNVFHLKLQCSYTFGKGCLFTKNKCSNPRSCLETNHEKYGTVSREKYSMELQLYINTPSKAVLHFKVSVITVEILHR
jgi:hypothetical protein